MCIFIKLFPFVYVSTHFEQTCVVLFSVVIMQFLFLREFPDYTIITSWRYRFFWDFDNATTWNSRITLNHVNFIRMFSNIVGRKYVEIKIVNALYLCRYRDWTLSRMLKTFSLGQRNVFYVNIYINSKNAIWLKLIIHDRLVIRLNHSIRQTLNQIVWCTRPT